VNAAAGYYDNTRPEVAELVGPDAQTILDVGCGSGQLGILLKKRLPGCRVFGIEYSEAPAAEAMKALDGVVIGDIERVTVPFDTGSFDCIIFADVLEHLLNPAGVLMKLIPLLKSRGRIICSIPNMRHYTVILDLIRHGWKYQDYGLFDRTHLRFFSLASMKELMDECGLSVSHVEPRIVASRKLKVINTLCLGKLEEFLAFQYLIVSTLRE
jgi:SAM-dependent methyltransferase